jgi:hypothetical protein
MGRFARTRWVAGQWTVEDENTSAGVGHDPSVPSLLIVIHDSDIAALTFSPGPPRGDSFFLGYEPSDYFQDPRASLPVDHRAVAAAFADWVRDATYHKVSKNAVRALMARPGKEPEDAFVEDTVARLLNLVGLAAPEYV